MCDLIGMTWLYCREVLMIFLDLLVKRVGNIPDRAARIGLFPPVKLVCHSLRYGVKRSQLSAFHADGMYFRNFVGNSA